MDEARRARRGLWVFFAVLIPLTALFEWMIVRRVPLLGRTEKVILLMWSPAVAPFVARAVTREGWGDLSFRIGGAAGRWQRGRSSAGGATFGAASSPPEGLWLGESGILVVRASLLLLAPLLRGSWSTSSTVSAELARREGGPC